MTSTATNPSPSIVAAHAQAIRERINEGAPLDSLVRELARQQAIIEELATQVKVLRAQRRLRDLALPQAEVAYKGLSAVRIDASLPLRAEHGFYSMEYDSAGHSFRWTGPSPTFHFDLHVDRSGPLRFALWLANGYGARADAVRAFSDGIEIPLRRVETQGRTEFNGALLPRETLGLTRLTFMPSEMFRPADFGGDANDARTLGVVFRELIVMPTSEQEALAYLHECDDATLLRMASSTTGGDDDTPQPAPLAALPLAHGKQRRGARR